MPRSSSRTLAVLAASVALLVLLVVLAGSAGAAASGARTTTLRVSGPGSVRPGGPLTVQVDLSSDGTPVGGAVVGVEVETAGGWVPAGTARTSADGAAAVDLPAPTAPTTYRARYAGDATYAGSDSATFAVGVAVVISTLSLSGPRALVDEHSSAIGISWRGSDGLPVSGRAQVWVHGRGQPWRAGSTFTTGADGRASLPIKPRSDT